MPSTTVKPIVVLAVDDHPLIRAALREVLGVVVGQVELIEASKPHEGLALARGRDLDLAILDLNFPQDQGLAFIREFRAAAPAVPVIVYTMHEDAATLRQAFASGAAGIVPKTHPPRLLQKAIELVLEGGIYVPPELARELAAPETRHKPGGTAAQISPQQYRILELLAMGLANKEIARKLDIASSTVKNQLTTVFGKLGVSNRTQAAIAARAIIQSGDAARAAK